MKHAATLLIKDIAYVYTMETDASGEDVVLKDAAIAVYHDRIIAMGSGDFSAYIDSSTRIINARGCIALPGFIDCRMQARPLLSPYLFEQHTDMDSYYEKHGSELLRDMHAWLFQLLQKGITTFSYVSKADMYEQALHRLHRHPYEYMPAVGKPGDDIMTCGYDPMKYPCIDPFYRARLLFREQGLCEREVLKRFTQRPAVFLGCSHIGSLRVGKQADILLAEGSSLSYVMRQLSPVVLRSIIKRGTQQFPHILI
ncbi:MAG: hypothetical protein HFG16_01495 [Erysipelotrichaceae bacterium]|jgi:cytosine/adenosine deaminase-related metal-dependent hydrolase|nr:hypothetical protein [Erysipelotrichaceae bacterium]